MMRTLTAAAPLTGYDVHSAEQTALALQSLGLEQRGMRERERGDEGAS